MPTIEAKNMTISAFVDGLSSKSPIPGGGGASALIGAIGVSLCTMVANLTLGKSKYAQYQEDIEHILSAACASTEALLTFIHDDAEVFEPLSKAYSIPKDEPNKSEILEAALLVACSVPMNVLREVSRMIDAIEQLSAKGSKLALSDVGVAAAACRSAMEGAVMNIYINTKLMKNRDHAININNDAELLLTDGINRCNAIYQQIAKELGSNP